MRAFPSSAGRPVDRICAPSCRLPRAAVRVPRAISGLLPKLALILLRLLSLSPRARR